MLIASRIWACKQHYLMSHLLRCCSLVPYPDFRKISLIFCNKVIITSIVCLCNNFERVIELCRRLKIARAPCAPQCLALIFLLTHRNRGRSSCKHFHHPPFVGYPMRYFQDHCSLIGWLETIRSAYLFPGEPKRIAETWCGNDVWMYAKITEALPRTVPVENPCQAQNFHPFFQMYTWKGISKNK